MSTQPVSSPSQVPEARKVAKYLLTLAALSAVLLSAFAAAKVYGTHRIASTNRGVRGALLNSPIDILLAGSSHTRLTYDVAALERATHRSAFLLSYNGLDLAGIEMLLEYLVSRAQPPPKIVIVEAYSSFLAREPQLQDLRLFFDAPPDLKRTIVSRYLPGNGLQHYTDLFDLVVNRNNELILTYPLNRFLEADLSYKGGYINRIAPGVTPREFAGFRAGKSASTPNREQLLALAKIISLARRSGIRLLFVESPLPAPVSANGGIQALKAIFSSTLREQNIPYIDGDKGFPIQEPQLFSDGNHLSSDGRARFTAYLARILNQQTLN